MTPGRLWPMLSHTMLLGAGDVNIGMGGGECLCTAWKGWGIPRTPIHPAKKQAWLINCVIRSSPPWAYRLWEGVQGPEGIELYQVVAFSTGSPKELIDACTDQSMCVDLSSHRGSGYFQARTPVELA